MTTNKLEVKGIERSMYAGPMRIPDSAGLLFEDKDGQLLIKIREMLEQYACVIIRKMESTDKISNNEPICDAGNQD